MRVIGFKCKKNYVIITKNYVKLREELNFLCFCATLPICSEAMIQIIQIFH